MKAAERCSAIGFLAVLFLSIVAVGCGPETSSYQATTDTISTSGDITIDGSQQIIHVTSVGATVQSDKIDECVIGFEAEDLNFAFTSNDELQLGSQTLELLRPLAEVVTVPGVDDRLFAVWQVPGQTTGQVTYSIEIEINARKITYRNTCTR